MSKQQLKSKILDNPAYRNLAAQLTLMQRNMPSSEDRVEGADGVFQTEPVLRERGKQVGEPEKMDLISDDSGEIDPIVTKKPESAPASFESIMGMVKLKEKHKIQRTEMLLDLILQSEAVTIGEES